jgi:hypothetical protein
MATIITVHGTNATGPEEGSKWWQRGSDFEKHIRELVESDDDSHLNFQPHIWDGYNSETSRRQAAAKLLARTEPLEAAAENYCLIGHSHGGSVIAHTLMQAAIGKSSLPHMRRWITIGTPHIVSKKKALLFSRLNLLGQAGYVAVTFYALLTLGLFFGIAAKSLSEEGEAVLVGLLFGVPLLGIFIALYLLIRFVTSLHFRAYKRKHRLRAKSIFSERNVSLWHADDEAIGGLRSLPKLHFKLFPQDFAAAPISLLAVFIVPVVLISTLTFEAPLAWLLQLLGDASKQQADWQSINAKEDILKKIGFLFVSWDLLVSRLSSQIIGLRPNMLLSTLGFPVFLYLAALALTYCAKLLARPVSIVLSHALNSAALGQIRASAFGSDAVGELATSAGLNPIWVENKFEPLPVNLATEISDMSNSAASAALIKYRNLIGTMAAADEKDIRTTLFSEYLTWNELVHTTYFNVPHFRMLMAYALSQSRISAEHEI